MDHPLAVLRSLWDDLMASTPAMRQFLIVSELDRSRLYKRTPRLTAKEQRTMAEVLCTQERTLDTLRFASLLSQDLPEDVLDLVLRQGAYFGDKGALRAYLGQKRLQPRHRRNAYHALLRAGGRAWLRRFELGLSGEELEVALLLGELPAIPPILVWHLAFTHCLEMEASQREIYLQLLGDQLQSEEVTSTWLTEMHVVLDGLRT